MGTIDATQLALAVPWKEFEGAELVMATHEGALAIAAQAQGLQTIGMQQQKRFSGGLAARPTAAR